MTIFWMKAISILLCAACMLPAAVSAGGFSVSSNDSKIVRVAIADDRPSAMLSLKGRFSIDAVGSGDSIMNGPFLNSKIVPTGKGFQIGAKEVEVAAIKVKVARDSNIYLDNRRFRGEIDIVRKPNGLLTVINYIGLEEYLYGVLYHEVSHRWPLESLKAQAIAARTFALYQMKQSKSQPYDVRCDIYSQVYGGRTSEKWATNRAVDLTRGQVLAYKGGIFPAYYHATCGGHTEDASMLWNMDIEPLKGVVCVFCNDSPYYKWTKTVPLATLQAQLADAGYKTGAVASVSVLDKNASGRADRVEIKDGNGVSIVLTGKDFRRSLGPNDLRSTKFDVSVKGTNLVFEGFGWGHGVGMCQWGARGMARDGKRVEEILRYYYPGAQIVNIDEII